MKKTQKLSSVWMNVWNHFKNDWRRLMKRFRYVLGWDMSERIAYQYNGDHILKFAGMEKLTGEQVADELNRLYTVIVEQNEEIAALEREVDAFCEDSVLTLGERTFSTEIDEQLTEDIIQFAQRLHSRWVAAPVSQWIHVSERLPEKGVPVLVYTPPCHGQEGSTGLDLIDPSSNGDVWLIHNESYEHYCAVSDGIDCTGPDETAPYTHWMPLPAAPRSRANE